MSSSLTKQIIAAGIGVTYAIVYGFWTMLLTGGGHGNFIWFLLFLFVEFFGLYFPLMAVLSLNLKSLFVKVVFGSLVVFNLITSTVMFIGWVMEPGTDKPSEFARMVDSGQIGWIVFSAAAHLLPTLVFAFLLVRSILYGISVTDEEDVVALNLS